MVEKTNKIGITVLEENSRTKKNDENETRYQILAYLRMAI